MTTSGVESRPADWLLAWLSVRGRTSRPTVDRACRAIAERFDARERSDRSPTHRYVESLRRIGHVEEAPRGLVVVPTTLCWTRRADRGVFVGARGESLRDELRLRLGPNLVASHPDSPWPANWGVAGECNAVSAAITGLEISVIHESGMQLLASLPTLEDAIAAWPDSGQPSALCSWEVAVDPRLGQWGPPVGKFVEHGLVRCTDRRPRAWMIQRAKDWRLLDSPEKRAVAWWAELARLGRPRLVYHRGTGRLVLPVSHLPPPVMVERPLIWASAGPPGREKKRWIYDAIEPERASEVARILGLQREDVS